MTNRTVIPLLVEGRRYRLQVEVLKVNATPGQGGDAGHVLTVNLNNWPLDPPCHRFPIPTEGLRLLVPIGKALVQLDIGPAQAHMISLVAPGY
jgi:hypothetical protein